MCSTSLAQHMLEYTHVLKSATFIMPAVDYLLSLPVNHMDVDCLGLLADYLGVDYPGWHLLIGIMSAVDYLLSLMPAFEYLLSLLVNLMCVDYLGLSANYPGVDYPGWHLLIIWPLIIPASRRCSSEVRTRPGNLL